MLDKKTYKLYNVFMRYTIERYISYLCEAEKN